MTLLQEAMVQYAKVMRHYGIGSAEQKRLFREGEAVQGFSEIAELMHCSNHVVGMVLDWERQSLNSVALVFKTDDATLRKRAEAGQKLLRARRYWLV